MTENKQTGVDEHAEIVISINDLLFIFRKKWHWFVLSLALFFCAGGLVSDGYCPDLYAHGCAANKG